MIETPWFERELVFGKPKELLPYFLERLEGTSVFFKNVRLENLQKYDSLDADVLLKSSLHPRLQVRMTPVDLAWFDAEHDDHHLVKITNILKIHAHRKK